MSEHDDGGPAFPHPGIPETYAPEWGMSLRDWFAGQALAGSLSNPMSVSGEDEEAWDRLVCRRVYEVADAMLKARKS